MVSIEEMIAFYGSKIDNEINYPLCVYMCVKSTISSVVLIFAVFVQSSVLSFSIDMGMNQTHINMTCENCFLHVPY